MQMSDHELLYEYRHAVNRKAQIGVLADLNAVSVAAMHQKLEMLGAEDLPPLRDIPAPIALRQTVHIDEERAMQLYNAGTCDLDMAEAGAEDTPESDPTPNIETAVELRGDGDGRLYMTAEGALWDQMGFIPGIWYAMNLDELVSLSGEGENQLKQLLQILMSSGLLTMDAEQGYTKLKAAVETVAHVCSDEAFVREGDVCRWTGTQGQMGEYHVNGHCTLELEEDTVTGMDLALDISTADPEGTLIPALTADYRLASDGGFHFEMMLDESEVQVELTLEGQHVPGTTPPQTTLPEGAVIMDITPAA